MEGIGKRDLSASTSKGNEIIKERGERAACLRSYKCVLAFSKEGVFVRASVRLSLHESGSSDQVIPKS